MCVNCVLTRQIAEQFLAEGRTVNTDDYTCIDEAAAELLGGHKGILRLNGLLTLSDEAAQRLSKHGALPSRWAPGGLPPHGGAWTRLGRMELDGLVSLSDAAARALAKQEGDLSLNGLKNLSNIAAKALANVQGNLSLNGLGLISDPVARALASHRGWGPPPTYHDMLSLDGLTSLSTTAAVALANRGRRISLRGLTSLSKASAEALAGLTDVDLPFDIKVDQAGVRASKQLSSPNGKTSTKPA